MNDFFCLKHLLFSYKQEKYQLGVWSTRTTFQVFGLIKTWEINQPQIRSNHFLVWVYCLLVLSLWINNPRSRLFLMIDPIPFKKTADKNTGFKTLQLCRPVHCGCHVFVLSAIMGAQICLVLFWHHRYPCPMMPMQLYRAPGWHEVKPTYNK